MKEKKTKYILFILLQSLVYGIGNPITKVAYESITPAKQKHLSRAAKIYLQKNGLLDKRFARFDAILILPDGTIDHIERAFDYIG